MKPNTALLAGAAALVLGASASAQTTINITGATAFRAAAHDAILATFDGGTATYAYAGGTLHGAGRAIFTGEIDGAPYIVRTRFSGSGDGIRDVIAGQPITEYLTPGNPQTSSGQRLGGEGNPAPQYETAVPGWSFSDVAQAISGFPTPALQGGPVGIVPFIFVAGAGAPTSVSNMTNQIHGALWSTGTLNLGFFTGAESDITAVATGRAGSSGTRRTILSETGYGAFIGVVQYDADTTTGEITEFGNGGHSSNQFVANVLNIPRSLLKTGGDPFNGLFVSYLTVSDALTITGYNEADGSFNDAVDGNGDYVGPVPLTYNGVRYSVENVRNGSYTLWGYQQLYRKGTLSPAEQKFDMLLRNTIPTTLSPETGIADDNLVKVRRAGNIDGGQVIPK